MGFYRTRNRANGIFAISVKLSTTLYGVVVEWVSYGEASMDSFNYCVRKSVFVVLPFQEWSLRSVFGILYTGKLWNCLPQHGKWRVSGVLREGSFGLFGHP